MGDGPLMGLDLFDMTWPCDGVPDLRTMRAFEPGKVMGPILQEMANLLRRSIPEDFQRNALPVLEAERSAVL